VQKREKGVINKNLLLLDSQRMVNQVANPALLKNIRKAASTVSMHLSVLSIFLGMGLEKESSASYAEDGKHT
jgi:hypothetical protein